MSTNLLKLDMSLPINSVEAYIARVNRLPLLSKEEEQALASRFRNNQDLAAARQLVISNLRFVVKIAKAYVNYGLALADLIQEGNIGLMKAVKRFDPQQGVRLVSFAVHWIKAEIQEFILRNWRVVKVATTKAQRKLFFNLRKTKERLGWFTNDEVNNVAEDLNVKAKTVREMETRMSGHDISFDITSDEDDEHTQAPTLYLEDHRYDPARLMENSDTTEHSHENLHTALEKLDDRSRDIIQKRWFAEPKATLHELAAHYSVSAERVRQLEQNAMKKLRTAMEAA